MKLIIITICLCLGISILAAIEDGFKGFIKCVMTCVISVCCIFLFNYAIANKYKLSNRDTIDICNKNDSTYVIPFKSKPNGGKYIKLKINDITIDALFDTGCSNPIVFSEKDYYKLCKANIVEKNKFIKSSTCVIANGDEINVYKFNLTNLIVGDIIIKNIDAYYLEKADVTLVGISLCNKFSSFTIDNEKEIIICKK